MILLDSNIFMYAAGAEHPHKAPSVRLLERVAKGEVEAGVDVEALQEILHRYRSIGRWEDGRRVYDLARRIVPESISIAARHSDGARLLMDHYPSLSARDALHASVCLETAASAICSYDRDFDAVHEVRRLEPSAVE